MSLFLTRKDLANRLRVNPRLISTLVKAKKLTENPVLHRFYEPTLCAILPTFAVGWPFALRSRFPARFATAPDIARMLKCSSATVLRHARNRKIPHYRFSPHCYRFLLCDLETWAMQNGTAKKRRKQHES